jgi:hypothetical protein
MINSIAFDSLRARRPIIGATALWLLLGFSGAVSATSLQDMFKTGETFTQDGLVFSNFAPVLANAFPAGQDLENLLKKDPLALFNVQALDFAAGKFSHGWGNARAADAGSIDFVILADNGATAGVDPGFRLDGATEWTVDAGRTVNKPKIASGQLSAFAYDVKKTPNSKRISSADISQISSYRCRRTRHLFPFPFRVARCSSRLRPSVHHGSEQRRCSECHPERHPGPRCAVANRGYAVQPV